MIFVGVDWAEAHHDVWVQDDAGAETVERLIHAAGFDPLKAGGTADAGRIEAPGGDLHQFGLMGIDHLNRSPGEAGHLSRPQVSTVSGRASSSTPRSCPCWSVRLP